MTGREAKEEYQASFYQPLPSAQVIETSKRISH